MLPVRLIGLVTAIFISVFHMERCQQLKNISVIVTEKLNKIMSVITIDGALDSMFRYSKFRASLSLKNKFH